MTINLADIKRFEVIDERGRFYVRRGVALDLSVQDNGTTLKVWARSRVGAAPADFVIDPNDPPRPHWPLGRIFRKIPQQWRLLAVETFVKELPQRRRTDLFGFILMACTSEQVAFLAAVHDHYPDDDVQTALRSICKKGRILDVIDPSDPASAQRLFMVYDAVAEASGKL